MSHRFTFESKRTFYFTKISTSFPLATSCPESAGQSVSLRYPTRPIFRFGTRPSTDRAVRPLPPVCGHGIASTLRTDLISASQYRPVYLQSINHHYGFREERKRGPQGIRRELEGRNPESLVYAFCGMLLQSGSVLVSPPQGSHPMRLTFQHGRPWTSPSAQECFYAGTGPSLRIFSTLSSPVFPAFGLSPAISTRLSSPAACR